jgi:pre-mRNA-splicing factor CDC5/CEF1
MGINTPRVNGFSNETPESSQSLSNLFRKLPKPRNDFEIILPEVEQETVTSKAIAQDTEDYLLEQEKLQKAEQLKLAKRRSQVVQRNLPRPILTSQEIEKIYSEKHKDNIDSLVMKEKAKLLHRDCKMYPLPSQPELGVFEEVEPYDELIDIASDLIADELKKVQLELIEAPKLYVDYYHDVSLKNYCGKSDPKSEYKFLRDQMKQNVLKSQPLEKKLGLKLGGYIHRNKVLLETFNEAYEELMKKRTDLETFRFIRDREKELIDVRIMNENKVLEQYSYMEQDLQDQYRELMQSQVIDR